MDSEAFIHPLSDVQTSRIGENTLIWQFCVIFSGASIGSNCNICSHCFIENEVSIGNNVTIKNGVYIFDGVRIADNVFIGHNVSFTNDKYPRSKSRMKSFPATIIGEGATIGAGSVLVPGITIGRNSIIGAGTLVSKDVPPNSLVRNRYDSVQSRLPEL
jgi:UDP-2-acetamido-3-amino-2,3-dideoxy-glucuronate N-acetyltransferase